MSHSTRTTLALGAALVGGLALSGSAFAMTDLAAGYMLGGAAGHGESKGGKHGHTLAHMDTDKDGSISQAEFGAAHDGDTSRFARYDTNKDGAISKAELDAAHAKPMKGMEGKCGEGKCGGAKAAEGKCGEGKCGEGKCGAAKPAEAKPAAAKPAKANKAMEGKCGEGKCGGAA